MFTAFLVLVHASRSVTNAFSGMLTHQQHRSLYVLGRRSGSNSSCRKFHYLTYRESRRVTKHRPSRHHQVSSSSLSSSPSDDDIQSIDSDGTTLMGIPSIEQLRTDSFMKQVRYAEFITGLIVEDNGRESDVLMNRLRAQLSHPDGIRGFMVTYLTSTFGAQDDSDGITSDDSFEVPKALIKAVVEQIDPIHDTNELISLMCMNVIMPTGMITMQPNEEMSQQSTQTSKRAVQLLKTVLSHCRDDNGSHADQIYSAITVQCNSILKVATEMNDANSQTDTDDEDKLIKFWRKFFHQWGYQSQEQSNIADVVRSILL